MIWKPVVAQGHILATVNAIGCKFESHSRKLLLLYFHFFALVTTQSVALSAATQHEMPPEFDRK